MRVVLGNRHAVRVVTDESDPQHPKTERHKLSRSKRATVVELGDDMQLGEALTAITAPQGVWQAHSDGPPAWVASDSPGLAALLAEHYGGCEVRDLDDPHERTSA